MSTAESEDGRQEPQGGGPEGLMVKEDAMAEVVVLAVGLRGTITAYEPLWQLQSSDTLARGRQLGFV